MLDPKNEQNNESNHSQNSNNKRPSENNRPSYRNDNRSTDSQGNRNPNPNRDNRRPSFSQKNNRNDNSTANRNSQFNRGYRKPNSDSNNSVSEKASENATVIQDNSKPLDSESNEPILQDTLIESDEIVENEVLDEQDENKEIVSEEFSKDIPIKHIAPEKVAFVTEKERKLDKKIEEFSDKDHTQVENLEQYLDLDVRTGVSKETEQISQKTFLSRGFTDEPDINTPHCQSYCYNCCKLATYDWMKPLEEGESQECFPIVEVRFKNSHKEFFLLPEEGEFEVGDIVAVESNPGHDIGIISMVGNSVKKQLQNRKVNPNDVTKKLYRHARVADIDKWISTVGMEHATMLSSRYIAWDLELKMKVNDVEYQGDGTKAIFYYSAEERVDFRELIKILAEQFKIRIEMRQIGVRQEAARLGGIGTCGRELCCSSWLTSFQSVSTVSARTQQLSLNPQKLAGMCGKLKCCLNFEQSTYVEELKDFPHPNTVLNTKKGKCFYNKIDIFKKIVWYAYANDSYTIFAIPLESVNKIIKMNKEGKYPDSIEEFAVVNQAKTEETNNYSLDELKNIEDK